jgi:LuxR family transcriptional regulator
VSSKLVDWQGRHTEALAAAQTEKDFFAALSKAARELGFDHCAYGMRLPLPLSNPKIILVNDYSEQWQQRYAQENYLAVDPTVAHGMRSVLPVIWTDSLFENCMDFWEDARAHNLKVGWAQSSYDARGAVGMLTLARGGDALTQAELQENAMRLAWLVQAAQEGMARLHPAARSPVSPVALTAREVEVLRWTADGKTSGEVGMIMAISERTVNFHINNALEKLGAVNKTAGVIKAAMLRLL